MNLPWKVMRHKNNSSEKDQKKEKKKASKNIISEQVHRLRVKVGMQKQSPPDVIIMSEIASLRIALSKPLCPPPTCESV